MAATGYVTGDPAKVDVSSVGEIGGPAGPLDGSGLIPSAQIPGGGGGGPSPAGTVTAETSYGASSAAGSASTYSKGDHTHGTPALSSSAASASAVGDTASAGSGTTPAKSDHVHGRESFGSVTAQTSFGASSGNGSAATPARSDHTHGTPAAPGRTWAFSLPSTLTTTTGKARIYNDTGSTMTIRSVRASVGTAPTGAAILVDVNVDGTTIFSGGTNRPQIAVSTNTNKTTGMSTTTIADGSYISVDVDQVGSTVAGADLVVQVEVG